ADAHAAALLAVDAFAGPEAAAAAREHGLAGLSLPASLEPARAVLEDLLAREPERRPTAADALARLLAELGRPPSPRLAHLRADRGRALVAPRGRGRRARDARRARARPRVPGDARPAVRPLARGPAVPLARPQQVPRLLGGHRAPAQLEPSRAAAARARRRAP